MTLAISASPPVTLIHAFGARHRHRARRLQRRPRALRLVLGKAKRIAPGLAEAGEGDRAGPAAADIVHQQAQRAADRGIGLPAGTEHAEAAIDADLARHRSVDDQHRRDVLVRGLHAAHVEVGIEHALDRGQHHRQIFRPATRHHGVGSDLLDSGEPFQGLDLAQHLGRRPVGEGERLLHPRHGRRHDRQAVAPAAPQEKLLQAIFYARTTHDFDALTRKVGGERDLGAQPLLGRALFQRVVDPAAGSLLARGEHDPEAAVIAHRPSTHPWASLSFIRQPCGSFTLLVVGKPSMPLWMKR